MSANIVFVPGNGGKNCPGNGEHTEPDGSKIECCCDECDYYVCCFPDVRHYNPAATAETAH